MKIKRLFIICSLFIFSFASCDYLGSEEYLHEVDNVNDIWKTRLDIRRAWAACYGYMPSMWDMQGSWPFSGGGDEGYAGRDNYASLYLAQGRINADNISSYSVNYWPKFYKAIRTCCQFLENSHQANDRTLYEGEVESYNADVRFLMSYYYSLMLEMYGPFVIVEHTVDYSSDVMPTTRATVDECVNYLVTSLDKSIAELPMEADQSLSDYGRPTRGAAMAVKARVLLWAASPLANGNKAYANFLNNENTPFFNQTYDQNKWQQAAQAYKDIIDLGVYELHTAPAATTGNYKTVALGDFKGNDVPWPDGPAGIDPYQSYKELFAGGKNYWNKEVIFQINTGSQNTYTTVLGWPRNHKSSSGTICHQTTAIQKQVDAFFMNNGKTISDEIGKLYVDDANSMKGDGKYIIGQSDDSPIKTKLAAPGVPNRVLNREARFYATIGFQNRGWLQEDKSAPYYYADFRADAVDGLLISDRPNNRTGYVIVKWVNDQDLYYYGNFDKQYPVFRLAEVYLAYAEALNEYDPTNPDIIRNLNLVRFRAGLPGYELADQATNRERIKHERQVELAFECGKRYFDMRRWKDAEKTTRDEWGNSEGVGGSIYGCNYYESDVSFFDRTIIDGYLFKQKDYFLPIPYTDVANHWGSMVQNPGW